MTNDDLIARLEAVEHNVAHDELCRDAAARVRELEAERDELRAANTHTALRAMYQRAEADNERLRADAERYRWLKINARRIDFAGLCVSDMAQLNARIDAALAAREK